MLQEKNTEVCSGAKCLIVKRTQFNRAYQLIKFDFLYLGSLLQTAKQAVGENTKEVANLCEIKKKILELKERKFKIWLKLKKKTYNEDLEDSSDSSDTE